VANQTWVRVEGVLGDVADTVKESIVRKAAGGKLTIDLRSFFVREGYPRRSDMTTPVVRDDLNASALLNTIRVG